MRACCARNRYRILYGATEVARRETDMAPEEGNEFFEHLDQQPAVPRRTRRPSSNSNRRPATGDFASVPDPFDDGEAINDPDHPLAPSGRPARPQPTPERPAKPAGPGLSPGVPKLHDRAPATREVPRSGVVLTPGGIKRVDDKPPGRSPESMAALDSPAPSKRPASRPQPAPDIPPDEPADADIYAESRDKNDADDVNWEEYAASGFPAMAAEEFGVKTKTTDSGRMVPVAVRSDLTDEAIKGKSVKGGGGAKPRPVQGGKHEARPPEAPMTFWGKVGKSFRLNKVESAAEEESTEAAAPSGKGFVKSGSQQPRKSSRPKKTPLGIAVSVLVEVGKILMLVLLLRAYVVQVSRVEGPSMEGTLTERDRLVVERVTALVERNRHEPWLRWLPDFMAPELERGDLVVLRSPEDPGAELVKRLIGLPGDTLRFEDGKLYLKPAGGTDFAEVNESYLNHESLKREDGTFRSYAIGDLGGVIEEGVELVVPDERVFVMGDNRASSNDSRRWLEIEVKRTEPANLDALWAHKSSIEGRVIFRIWPSDRIWPPVK